MAKIVAAAAPAAAEEPARKSGKKSLIIAGAVGLIAIVAGAAVPMCFRAGAQATEAEPESHKNDPRQALIAFDSLVVNVADGRYTRYLRVKITLVVDAKDEKGVKEVLEKEKPFLQTWVLGYLQDKTMEQLHGSAGMNRVRREVRDEFNRRLLADGSDKIRDILLTEYNFQ